MSATILDGKSLASRVRETIRARVAELPDSMRKPGLALVRVGDDPASGVYVRNKEMSCRECGMRSLGAHLSADSTASRVLATIKGLNENPEVDGILLQLPLPDRLDPEPLLSAIDPSKDVDGFHPTNAGHLLAGHPRFVPCTPRGILALLDDYDIPLPGARAVVIGRSNIVGKPVSLLLLARHATVTICHSRTRDLWRLTRQADILVSATGQPGSVGAEAVRAGAVVVDVGISRVTDRDLVYASVTNPKRLEKFEQTGALLLGDVKEEVREVAGCLTPVPGGVGPLTVAMLLQNTWDGFAARNGLSD